MSVRPLTDLEIRALAGAPVLSYVMMQRLLATVALVPALRAAATPRALSSRDRDVLDRMGMATRLRAAPSNLTRYEFEELLGRIG